MNHWSTIVDNYYLKQKATSDKILLSALLADPPSDEVLLNFSHTVVVAGPTYPKAT